MVIYNGLSTTPDYHEPWPTYHSIFATGLATFGSKPIPIRQAICESIKRVILHPYYTTRDSIDSRSIHNHKLCANIIYRTTQAPTKLLIPLKAVSHNRSKLLLINAKITNSSDPTDVYTLGHYADYSSSSHDLQNPPA